MKPPCITETKKLCKLCYTEQTKFPVVKGKEKSFCEECYSKKYGDIFTNHEELLKKRRTLEKTIKQKNISFVYSLLKTKQCINCGNKDYRVLEFDHRERLLKNDNVSNLINNGTLAQVKEEVSKCDIICANCHRIKTHEENNSWKHNYFLKYGVQN